MRRRRGPNPLAAPLLVFAAVIVLAACYVAYVLWPRWPEAPVALDAPSLPIVVAGVAFNIAPAAIRFTVQRRPGAQERVDLDYLWPSLSPPDPARKPTLDAARRQRPAVRHHRVRRDDAADRRAGEDDLSALPRDPTPVVGPTGLSLRAFRDETAYAGRGADLRHASARAFLLRCSRHGVDMPACACSSGASARPT